MAWQYTKVLAALHRLKEIALATYHTYLFLEFIPNHLYECLNKQLSISESAAINVVRLVESQMQKSNYFMGSQHFLHMDAHVENILTDGKQLYYSDFSLALSDIENHFAKDNADYACASRSPNLMHTVLTSYLVKDDWNAINLAKFTNTELGTKILSTVVKDYCLNTMVLL